MLRLAKSEAQDVADAASQAALVVLRQSGSTGEARAVAEETVSLNTVLGVTPSLTSLEFGVWDEDTKTFSSATSGINSIRVEVTRSDADAIPLVFGPFMGIAEKGVTAQSTSAGRRLEVALVMDITGSWAQQNFDNARTAALSFLDIVHQNHGIDDRIGMALFMQRYAWEYTPLTSIEDSAANPSLVTTPWGKLNVGSFAGDYQAAWVGSSAKHVACNVYATNSAGATNPLAAKCTTGPDCYRPTDKNNFEASTPDGGCFPEMPRFYLDEGGTDHYTGLQMARTMLSETDPTAYRAAIVLTDGQAAEYSTPYAAQKRQTTGYVETRFREYANESNHSVAEIRTDTVALANEMYNEENINIWFVSFVEYDSFMEAASQGDGYFALASSSSEIVRIFEDIARELPVVIVD